MNYKLTKKEVLTIPNLLSFVRLLLIPFILYYYIAKRDYFVSLILIIASGATDIIDGFIARKFNMISDFGKLLDPVADKLTQAAMIYCVFTKYPLVLLLIIIFVIKETMMFVLGYLRLKNTDTMTSANWYGKVNTIAMYCILAALIIFTNMSIQLANILIIVCAGFMTLALVMYFRFFIKVLFNQNN